MIDLKDQFALEAMAALLQRPSNSTPHYADIANSAWQCAEFMMSERQKRIDLAALNEKRNNNDMRTLKLSTRLHYALLSEDLYTIADICAYTEKEILRIPNIGRTQLAHFRKRDTGKPANDNSAKAANDGLAGGRSLAGLAPLALANPQEAQDNCSCRGWRIIGGAA